MNFFKQAELNILNSYPLNQVILLSDYLCDFVLQNPLNYPYTSFVMKRLSSRKSSLPLTEQYSKETVSELIGSIKGRDDSNCRVYVDMLQDKNPSFTCLAICLYNNFHNAKIVVHQKEPCIVISIIDGSHKHSAMIDSTGSTILCYHSSDSVDIYPMFVNKTWNSVAEISNNCECAEHYYFEYNNDDELIDVLNMIHAITCHKPPSWFMEHFDETIKYHYKESIMSGYNIMRLCDSFDCVEDALVKNDAKKKLVSHQEQVMSPINGLFNKTVVAEN